MSIVESRYVLEHEQHDGTRWVLETHIDSSGNEYRWDYRANPGMDYDVILAEHAEALNARMAEAEAATTDG